MPDDTSSLAKVCQVFGTIEIIPKIYSLSERLPFSLLLGKSGVRVSPLIAPAAVHAEMTKSPVLQARHDQELHRN